MKEKIKNKVKTLIYVLFDPRYIILLAVPIIVLLMILALILKASISFEKEMLRLIGYIVVTPDYDYMINEIRRA